MYSEFEPRLLPCNKITDDAEIMSLDGTLPPFKEFAGYIRDKKATRLSIELLLGFIETTSIFVVS